MSTIPVYEPWLTSADAEAVAEVIRGGWVSSGGEQARAFERAWAAYCGMPHGVGVSSGTAALELALRAAGLGPGDEVLCPSFTIISCGRAIVAVGATPVWVDCDPETYGLCPDDMASVLGPRSRAVLAVHLYGHPFDAERLRSQCRERGLILIEDAAEAHGVEAEVDDRWQRAGGLGDISVFSFYANKALTTGEGGMVLCRDRKTASRIRSLANLCFEPDRRFLHRELGHNYRLSNVQAALGLSQLSRIDTIIARKRWVADQYRGRLAELDGVTLPGARPWARPVPWMVGVVLDDGVGADAAEIGRELAAAGVQTRPYFLGMHEQPALAGRDGRPGRRLLVTERLGRRGLYLPSSPTLDESTIDRVCDALRKAVAATPSRAPGWTAAAAAPSLVEEEPFGSLAAAAYDRVYADKDYALEASALIRCFERHADQPVTRVLDLGCGTGRHLMELARRGCRGVGVDRSEPMLAAARRAAATDLALEWHCSPIESLQLEEQRFDAVTMLFAVLSYQAEDEQLRAALSTCRAHLCPGGLLLADVWYGPAVLATPPAPRLRTVDVGDGRITRRVSSDHDPLKQQVTVRYELERVPAQNDPRVVVERHRLRYFFPRELELLLDRAGFELCQLSDFPDVDRPPTLNDYSAMVVAKVV